MRQLAHVKFRHFAEAIGRLIAVHESEIEPLPITRAEILHGYDSTPESVTNRPVEARNRQLFPHGTNGAYAPAKDRVYHIGWALTVLALLAIAAGLTCGVPIH